MMTHLTPIVTEIGLFKKEGTLHFLDGNKVYFTMSERKGRGTATTYWMVDVNHPKSRRSLDSASWPKVPTCPKTGARLKPIMFAVWLIQRSWMQITVPVYNLAERSVEYRDVNDVSYSDFLHVYDDDEIRSAWSIDKNWVQAATSKAQAIIDKQNELLSKAFVPMREAGFEESEVVARVLSFDGDEKQLVQGLQRLGVSTDGLKKRNFVTKGLQFDNLEELIFKKQPG